MKFTKMQGIGNDYVYVNCLEERVEHPSETAIKVSDRHFGIGSDGMLTEVRAQCAETECAVWENMCMTMV